MTATDTSETAASRDAVALRAVPRVVVARPPGRWRRAVRDRPWGTAVVVLGVVVRAAATVAYRPVLEFHGDSYHYLDNARHLGVDLWHPIGYAVFLRSLSWTGSLLAVAAVQHLLGLATGMLLYRLVRRRGLGDLAAALAAAPILLDAWQVVVEHTVIAEPVFELLLVAGVLLLLRPTLRSGAAAAAGLLLAAATLTRTVGVFVGGMALLYLLVRRVGWRPTLAGAAAFALPLVGYGLAFRAQTGSFGLQGYSGRYLYGEAATFARCPDLDLPARLRPLCPSMPVAARPGANSYVWADDSPVWLLRVEDPVRLSRIAGTFAWRAIRRQPVSFLRYVGHNAAHYFDVGRVQGPRDYTAATWQFPATTKPPPVFHISTATIGLDGRQTHPTTTRSLVDALRSYQRIGFTPGPALALAAVLGLAGAAAARRRGSSPDPAFLTVTGLVVVVATSATSVFDYRYLLPALLLLPAGGVLGAAALWRRRPRPRLGRGTRVLAVASVCLALLATNALTDNVVAADRQQGGRVLAAGQTARLPGGLTVTVDRVSAVSTRCAMPSQSVLPHVERTLTRPTEEWAFRMHVRVTDTGRERRFVQSWNLAAFARGEWTPMWAYAGGPYLHDTVVGPGHRTADGVVFAWLPVTEAVATYTDPTGGGTASWRLQPRPPSGAPPAGRPCTPTGS